MEIDIWHEVNKVTDEYFLIFLTEDTCDIFFENQQNDFPLDSTFRPPLTMR